MSLNEPISYLNQSVSKQIDIDLMGSEFNFNIHQLMELAGLSCAQVINRVYEPSRFLKVLICCGPGNQGGDGLVAARHLWHFGHSPTVYYPKQTEKDLYKNLLKQCENLRIPIVSGFDEPGDGFKELVEASDVIVDSIFGFSFRPPIRVPFESTIRYLKETKRPIVSIDIPSGWDIENGKDLIGDEGLIIQPDVLVSLTLPKLGSKDFKGRHFLGGRFLPPGIVEKYQLKVPNYPGSDQIVEITDL
ncbi:YjeF N-terminal domain-containing protein [Phakopsora pachyrhizi]|uniref:NAD(P)H-hydrate epimerase n=1 Tax=Phakopsora pachyrhizi TaxID=170000 RepID=A0AAV0BTR6_PHAPC|nr:YjeF N-terminal domain-containing protein [Phakopsora pachyrhizi]CAH7689834.1 YjeF N-terminal domain-containing protein [Phakopsora pachyrhizi]